MEKLEIHFQEYAKVRKAAIDAGMSAQDAHESMFDYVDPSYGETRIFAGHKGQIEAAFAKAKQLADQDVWKCPRVYLVEWIGHPKTGYWEDRAFWECGKDDKPNPKQPDQTL